MCKCPGLRLPPVYRLFTVRVKLVRYNHNMNENDKATVTINIRGGNIQILPNATKVEQHFYGDLLVPDVLKSGGEAQPDGSVPPVLPSVAVSPLSLYINKVEVLSEYESRLSACTTARQMGNIVVDMVHDPQVKVDEDLMVKREFISMIQPLSPMVTTGVGNIRKYINEAWSSWRK